MINSKKRNLIKSKQTNLRTKNRRNTKRYSKKSNRKYIKKNTHKKGGMDMEVDEEELPITSVPFAPVEYTAPQREKLAPWKPNDYILLAHGGDMEGKFQLDKGQSIHYHYYCPPGSKLKSEIGEDEHIQLLKENKLKPYCQQDTNEIELLEINNYKLHPSNDWQAGLYTAGMGECIMPINDETTFKIITQRLFEYVKQKSKTAKSPKPHLYVNTCLHGSTDLSTTKRGATPLDKLLKNCTI